MSITETGRNADSRLAQAVRSDSPMREGEMAEPTYTATATSSGDGRNGHVRSAEGHIDQGVRIPSSFGGPGGATNPEELFAAAYAVCFHNALRLVAKDKGVAIGDDSTVDVAIGIGQDDTSFAINATITAHLPDVDAGQAQGLLAAAHRICPYSKATRGNIPVDLRVA
jgi:Ohr subfamily peroxiredoxin